MSGLPEVPVPAVPRVTVIVPCKNESSTVGKVVADFRAALPQARIVVVDNASTDGTAGIARATGAEVVAETRPGKGFALLTGLRHAGPSDIFIMVDGDDTYPADAAPQLLAPLAAGADMVIGTRLETLDRGAFPAGHSLGNRLFNAIVRLLFGIRTGDLFSGYRAFTSRYLEECPLIARGFEIEAELSLQAFAKGFVVAETPVAYRARGGDSRSKLRTVHDGTRILMAILTFFRDYRPLTFFGSLSAVLLALSLGLGTVVVREFVATGLVPRLPTAVLALGLLILSALSLACGVVLSSINRRAEELQVLLLTRRRS